MNKKIKTRDELLKILTSLDGCQITSTQLQAQLTKRIGKATINWHINKFVNAGLIEVIGRNSSNLGNVIRVKENP